jgi:hypothetical protein
MIKFNCPKCLRSLQSGDSKAGKSLRCPSCSELITVPPLPANAESPEENPTDPDAFVLSVLNQEPDGSDTRKCQYCAETIKADAIKCRFCGEVVRQISESSLGVSGIGEEPTIYGLPAGRPRKTYKVFGGIGCGGVIVLTVFFWLILLLLTFFGGVYLAIAFLVLVILLAVLQLLT